MRFDGLTRNSIEPTPPGADYVVVPTTFMSLIDYGPKNEKDESTVSNFEGQIRRHANSIQKIRFAWEMLLPELEVPRDSQIYLWLELHDFDLQKIHWGISKTARRHSKSPLVFDHAIRYCSAVLNNLRTPITRPSLPDAKYFRERAA
jgi:hypothetical protein